MSKNLKIKQKLLSLEKAKSLVKDWQETGQKVVFTNGCFDILHVGHVDYLSKAADLGDKLILGLNSDNSVKRLEKGDDRPLNNESSRAFILGALDCIDGIVIFNEDTPFDLIKNIEPDILVKGGDYDPTSNDPTDKKYIVGSDIVKNKGGKIEVIQFVEGFSTTSLVEKIRKAK